MIARGGGIAYGCRRFRNPHEKDDPHAWRVFAADARFGAGAPGPDLRDASCVGGGGRRGKIHGHHAGWESELSFSVFHYAEKSETIVTISPDALPALLAILAKFEAWEKTAREKNGTTFTKVIGKLDRQEVYFRWSREGQSVDLMLPKPPVPEAVQAKFGVAYISGSGN